MRNVCLWLVPCTRLSSTPWWCSSSRLFGRQIIIIGFKFKQLRESCVIQLPSFSPVVERVPRGPYMPDLFSCMGYIMYVLCTCEVYRVYSCCHNESNHEHSLVYLSLWMFEVGWRRCLEYMYIVYSQIYTDDKYIRMWNSEYVDEYIRIEDWKHAWFAHRSSSKTLSICVGILCILCSYGELRIYRYLRVIPFSNNLI